jgi:DNA repair exonuclease SbcCD ATPase subunit
MNRTKVDDTLIQMIEPKIHEIEQRFSGGQALNQEDINTLLLKSQYNHINHLDEKLNEVTADVASLKGDFRLLEEKVDNRISSLEGKFDTFRNEIKLDIKEAMVSNMKWSIGLVAFVVTMLKILDIMSMKY